MHRLYEYRDNGEHVYFGPASDVDISYYKKALEKGQKFFFRGYHGYQLKMLVVNSETPQTTQG